VRTPILLVTLLLAGTLPLGRSVWADQPAEIWLGPKPMAALVAYLADGGPGPKADLAWIALTELIQSFETELDRAFQALQARPGTRAKLRRWNAGAAGYVADLRALQGALERGAYVALDSEPDGSLLVIVAGRPTVVSGPDLAHQKDLEQRIIESFCSIHDCPVAETEDQKEDEHPWQQIASRYAPEVGVWTFGDHRAIRYETSDGLAFEFSDPRGRPSKALACNALAKELRQVLRALRQARDAGHSINWRRLALEAPPRGEDPRLVVNREGAYMVLPVPELARQPALLAEARPWLEARMADRPYLLIISGDDLISSLDWP